MTRVFLSVTGLIFLSYGIACALDPALPARLAGLDILNGDGYAEMGAMYGGLQSGAGLFLILAAFRPGLWQGALFFLALGVGLLAALRAGSALRTQDAVSIYTWGALLFETLVSALAAYLTDKRAVLTKHSAVRASSAAPPCARSGAGIRDRFHRPTRR